MAKKSQTKAVDSMLGRLNAASDGVAPRTTSHRAEGLASFAESMDISRDTAYRRAREGKLRTVKFGRRILVPLDEVARVLKEGL